MGIVVTEEDCALLLKSIGAGNVRLISHELKRFSETPVGFLAVHHRLILNCGSNNNDVEQTFRFFVKTMPSVKIHSDYINDIGAFEKEKLLFRGLLPEMQQVSKTLDPWSPKCYIAKDNMLILEDLCVQDYRPTIGMGIFEMDECMAALKTLADFHASSLIWEIKNDVKINVKHRDCIKECVYVQDKGHPRRLWLISATNALALLCKKIGRRVDHEWFSDAIKNAVADMGPSPSSCNVLCHGDLWANNFMFRKDEDGALRGILVDYQIARYAPCALDLMCCIYLITRQSFRNSNMSLFINMYYDKLKNALLKNNVNVESYLTLDKLNDECSRYKVTAIVEACIFGITIWLPPALVEEALGCPLKCHDLILGDRSKLMEVAFEDAFFKSQLTDLLNELLDCY